VQNLKLANEKTLIVHDHDRTWWYSMFISCSI